MAADTKIAGTININGINGGSTVLGDKVLGVKVLDDADNPGLDRMRRDAEPFHA